MKLKELKKKDKKELLLKLNFLEILLQTLKQLLLS
jgi:hypothetical protein